MGLLASEKYHADKYILNLVGGDLLAAHARDETKMNGTSYLELKSDIHVRRQSTNYSKCDAEKEESALRARYHTCSSHECH